MTLAEKKQALIEELSLIPDPQERFTYVIDRAKEERPLPEELKIDAFRVPGCQSKLWLVPSLEDGRCTFRTDSDAIITKGIASLLTRLYTGETPVDILAHEPDFLAQVGITQHLTPNRRNGLANVWQRIKGFAEACRSEPANLVSPEGDPR